MWAWLSSEHHAELLQCSGTGVHPEIMEKLWQYVVFQGVVVYAPVASLYVWLLSVDLLDGPCDTLNFLFVAEPLHTARITRHMRKILGSSRLNKADHCPKGRSAGKIKLLDVLQAKKHFIVQRGGDKALAALHGSRPYAIKHLGGEHYALSGYFPGDHLLCPGNIAPQNFLKYRIIQQVGHSKRFYSLVKVAGWFAGKKDNYTPPISSALTGALIGTLAFNCASK